MENNNKCGVYNIQGYFFVNNTIEKFGNSQSIYIELDNVSKNNESINGCNIYNPIYPFDKCILETKNKNNNCNK